MLKQRLLTAAILIPVVIWITISLPPLAFLVFAALVVVMGAWEWAWLTGIAQYSARALFAAIIAIMIVLSQLFASASATEVFLSVALLWWVWASWDLLRCADVSAMRWLSQLWLRVFSGALVLLAGWLAMVQLHAMAEIGPIWVLFLFALIWSVDSAAYFVGRRFGKHRLAPLVSPGKTWEGFWGGLLGAVLISLLGLIYIPAVRELWMGFIVLCVITAVFSVMGDLFESAAKRRAQVKDSGQILPGHGGILDRIDSLLAAAPVFMLGLTWLQR